MISINCFFRFLLCFVSSICIQSLTGQSFYFHLLDQNKGLSDEVNAYFQVDEQGYFWVSSRTALNKYDGTRINNFYPNRLNSSIDPNISSKIFNDLSGRKWFTSSNALLCLSGYPDTLSFFQIKGYENEYYHAFYINGNVLSLIVGSQIFELPLDSLDERIIPKHLYHGAFTYPIIGKDSSIIGLVKPLLEENQGIEILKYQPTGGFEIDSFFISKTDKRNDLRDTFIFYPYIENDTSLWLPSSIGLIQFNPKKPRLKEIHSHKELQASSSLGYRAIYPWRKRYFWIVTQFGELLLFDRKTEEFPYYQNQFMVEGQIREFTSFNNLLVDQDENLWISSFNNGIIYSNIKNNKFKQIIPIDTLAQSKGFKVNGIIENEDGSFFIIVFQQGIYHLIQKQNGQFSMSKIDLACCSSQSIYSIQKDSSGDIWIIDEEKITIWKPSINSFLRRLNSTKYTYHIVEVSHDEYLISSLNKILYFKKSSDIDNIDDLTEALKKVDLAVELYYDKKSELAFVSQNNNLLRVFDPKPPFDEKEAIKDIGLINGFFRSDHEPVIWMASSTGLYKYFINSHEIQKINSKDKLLDQSYIDVVEDKNRDIWLSTYWGIYKYDQKKDTVVYFTQSDGLITMQYNDNVSIRRLNGSILFGGNNGILLIEPDSIKLNTTIPKIILEEALINNEIVSPKKFTVGTQYQRIQYNQNNIKLQFSIIEFSDPALNEFKSFLIKNGNDTIDINPSTLVNIPNLDQGAYRLDCYASNSDGIWTTTPLSLYFKVLPPWYFSWWGILLWILLIASILYAWYRNRIQQIQKKEAEKRRIAEFKRKEAEFKQKEAEYKQLVAETETAVLRLQMEPHFIFNSMNAINNYLLSKDVGTASEYLQRFALLMRRILELSEHKYIDIEEEKEFLQLYLEAERMRMGKKMKYAFEIDPNVDEETLIPPMILQPFIENAVWHGIAHKKEGGIIIIRFLMCQNQLLCEVEDNGIGRKAAKKLTNKDHKSKATDITNSRLELIANELKKEAKFIILDLYDNNNKPAGTKVQLFLPIID